MKRACTGKKKHLWVSESHYSPNTKADVSLGWNEAYWLVSFCTKPLISHRKRMPSMSPAPYSSVLIHSFVNFGLRNHYTHFGLIIFSYVCTSLLSFHQIIDWFWLEETLKTIQFLPRHKQWHFPLEGGRHISKCTRTEWCTVNDLEVK